MYHIFLVFFLVFYSNNVESQKGEHDIVLNLIQMWSEEIGRRLDDLSRTMTREAEVEKHFWSMRNKLTEENPLSLVVKISESISSMMDTKEKAVKRIAEYAEYLSYNRPNENFTNDWSYHFYNADNITNDERDEDREAEMRNYILNTECHWYCDQANFTQLPDNIFSDKDTRDDLFKPHGNEIAKDCDCKNLLDKNRPAEHFLHVPLEYNEQFDEKVNFNMSIVRFATNVWQREETVLEGLKWSEPLDLVFKENLYKDPSLTWQYFASPRGFMRHYPAVKWSEEPYDQTYDFRTRTWYTEAITSPKDIIILLDISGSMTGTRRQMSMQVVNQILDTLNDNDFVNIYTFNNVTKPLVDCFSDTLFQANEENLRLLRENLTQYDEVFAANLTLGMVKAFQILETFRKTRTSANCNQAIMLITEGVDYEYNKEVFRVHNWNQNFPVRIFTYQIGTDPTDANELEWIACANMGWWANITHMGDIREKMLNYLNVMSRPINYNAMNKKNASYIWSYLHVDLADRRLSNWLWKKFEGIRQRKVFLDHIKRIYKREKLFFDYPSHMLLKTTHDYEQYINKWRYKYMTTVSLPVYGRRKSEVELIGVAGIDVPIPLFKAHIPFQRLGVNGYAFIVTNNGYILMHPDHRTEFEDILKPTFNRVDILEVEILNDQKEPRLFGDQVVQFREMLVKQKERTPQTLNVKFPLDDNKRVVLAKRHYYYAPIGPFTLGIVLPDDYGKVKIDDSKLEVPPRNSTFRQLRTKGKWTVHPEWIYCKNCTGKTQEEKLKNAFENNEKSPLLISLWYDMDKTSWFYDKIPKEEKFKTEYLVQKVFLSTYSGLTRWKVLNDQMLEDERDNFEKSNNKSIEEDWYRRTVDMNFKDPNIFIYSVPFETSGYENNTMITSMKTIFMKKESMKTPIGVVGLQFNHRAMYKLYKNITTKCGYNDGRVCKITCFIERLNCYILDNNAYVVLSEEPEFIGRYMGDIRPDIMADLIYDKVFIPTRMFNYQAICQKLVPKLLTAQERLLLKKERTGAKSSATTIVRIFDYIYIFLSWLCSAFMLIMNFPKSSAWEYQTAREDMKTFNHLAINKTVPTPCDHEMWLFNLNDSIKYPFSPYRNADIKFNCHWFYAVQKIPSTNLLFLATNDFGPCTERSTDVYSTEPSEIDYTQTLPCYIATKNNYSRRMYMKCNNRNTKEDVLNQKSRYHCGHNWE